ncbi:uncharacterized protein [Aristolochia californica]|uniref:uncharacterized protein n=1 Tax=Aristolochia californica TaxID=171875 RepID=UPI0035DB3EFE
MANATLHHLSMKLPILQWQRYLTDSTVLRNMGVGLGYCLLAYRTALQGIEKLQVMRRYAVPEPYEKLKDLTRGRAVTQESLRAFLQGLELPKEES